MSKSTPNLGLFEYDPNTDGEQTFNIRLGLNENWDKLDAFAQDTAGAAADVQGSLDAHAADRDNPHGVTAEQVGAAAAEHTHDERYYTEMEVNALLSSKQDAATAINTGNIGSQSVNFANYSMYANAGNGFGVPSLRNEYFASADTTPSANGEIGWTYG